MAVTLPLLGQGLGPAAGQGLGLRTVPGQGLAPGSRQGQGPVQEHTTLLPYQDKQREAAELAEMTRATGTAPGQVLESAQGPGLGLRPGLASGTGLGRDLSTSPPTSLPSSPPSSSTVALRRAYQAMWRNTLLSSQPRYQDLPVLPLSPSNAYKLALALCPEGNNNTPLCYFIPPDHSNQPPSLLSTDFYYFIILPSLVVLRNKSNPFVSPCIVLSSCYYSPSRDVILL